MSKDAHLVVSPVNAPHNLYRSDPFFRVPDGGPVAILPLLAFRSPFAQGFRPVPEMTEALPPLEDLAQRHVGKLIVFQHAVALLVLPLAVLEEHFSISWPVPTLGGIPLQEHRDAWARLTPGFWVVRRFTPPDEEKSFVVPNIITPSHPLALLDQERLQVREEEGVQWRLWTK